MTSHNVSSTVTTNQRAVNLNYDDCLKMHEKMKNGKESVPMMKDSDTVG